MHTRSFILPLSGAMLWTTVAFGQSSAPRDVTVPSVEELMRIEVTSASRKEQRADDVPAAIFVLTREDIRRSGMTRLPDVLRLVPGVQVAAINSSKWAVSVRGFNDLYANKLLVLIDGRTVYNRLFSGVLWDVDELLLEDIERIEVIRGPGAAVWGANAVNGVINILTRSSADTPGTFARVSVGTSEAPQAAVRHGGRLGGATYRVFAQGTHSRESLIAPGREAADQWNSAVGGFRGDVVRGDDRLVLDGRVSGNRVRAQWLNMDPQTAAAQPVNPDASEAWTAGLLARWTRTQGDGSSWQVQSFVDAGRRHEPVAGFHHFVADLEGQWHTPVGTRHDLVAGGGYRFVRESFSGGIGYGLVPPVSEESFVSAFVQDEIALAPRRLALTVGTKIESGTHVQGGLQPTARLMWHVPGEQHAWAAVSRALRTPSLQERGIRVAFPPTAGPGGIPMSLFVSGDAAYRTEEVLSREVGYRVDLGTVVSIDVAAYWARFSGQRTQEPGVPVLTVTPTGPALVLPVRFDTLLDVDTRGVEVVARWTPSPRVGADASYTRLDFRSRPQLATRDPKAAGYDGDAPAHQWQAHGAVTLTDRLSADARVMHVGRLRQLNVPAYTRVDARLEWRLSPGLSLEGLAGNLLDEAHQEFSGEHANLLATRMPRTFGIRLTTRF